MASLVSLQSRIAIAKARLLQLNTALTALSTTSVSPTATADTTATLDARIDTIAANLVVMNKEVADIIISQIEAKSFLIKTWYIVLVDQKRYMYLHD